jgi:uncharacterized repeat protein (TIGR02543 family)
MNGNKSVSATFTKQTYALTITRTGTGSGIISSSPAGIYCGAACSATFNSGSLVTLTAIPDANSTFTGWSGAATGSSPTVIVTIDAAKSVTATFTINQPQVETFTLTISRTGNGSGVVTSTPAGIDCGSTCTVTFDAGTVVTLTATPDANSTFGGWSGSASGTGTATITIDANKSVTATFEKKKYDLIITRNPLGGSVVINNDPENSCNGEVCTSTRTTGESILLTAIPKDGWRFVGWAGSCTGTDPTVTLLMDAAKNVTAVFERIIYSLTVTISMINMGSGTVTTSPTGIDYGSGPTNDFYAGTVVTLTATPASDSKFNGWSGAASGTGTATITMDANKYVNATFEKKKYSILKSIYLDLIAFRITVTDKQDGKKLDEVIKNITNALDLTNWNNGDDLNSQKGDKVFSESKDAVNKLRNLIKEKKSAISSALLQAFIDRIVQLNRDLALTAIYKAIALNGNSNDILKAKDELSKGDKDISTQNYDSGINHYRNAWDKAIKSSPSVSVQSESNEIMISTIEESAPKEFGLLQNYPNPFNPITTINYNIAVDSRVVLKIFDLLGKEIVTLVNDELSAGYYKAEFDGSRLASGIYIYQINAIPSSGESKAFVKARKLILMK